MPPATVPTERKQATREKILRQAARAMRAHGPAGVGVAEIMRSAGLTHGGFYAHFGSKDDLVTEAIRGMFAEGSARFASRVGAATGIDALRCWADSYLSPSHRDNPGNGCAVAALSGDLARLSKAARAAFDAGIEGIVARYMRHLPQRDAFDAQGFALAMLTQMAGAVAMARAVADQSLSDTILNAARQSVQQRLNAIEKAA
ncbi:TetR/AcrR family transcriptional regulator [Ferrovibrio terrae]|uniref:TetR/AcrR family transcriptional regulator n=1 Tax=Ferrovibrio terrae TaxID=2594003 RepID=UPI003137F386